ncbi:soluble P-type ATPase [Lachnospiraceae bacterium JC7]|nr:soluble P-type ATPase [Lachnospiraceae bacterium JC7]
MINIDIPGRGCITIEHLVLDYNGTVAEDGELIDGIEDILNELKSKLIIHILTADTYGTVRQQCKHLGVSIETFPKAEAALCKLEIVKKLGDKVMCIGNGYNDVLMMDEAALSVAVIGKEGAFSGVLTHADIVNVNILDALMLLIHTDRIRATLRS